MKLESAVRTDVGRRRKANEDRYAIAAHLGIYLVADGMGRELHAARLDTRTQLEPSSN